MAEILTDKLVKFAFGSKANYSAQSHSDFVYFAKDVPLIHANGMWRGVSGVSLSGNTLTITTAEKDSDNSNSVNTNVTVDLSSIATTSTQRANWDSAYNFVKSITDDDTDTVINKWQEIVDFLAGINGTTLQGIVDTKADKATKVFGYNGIKIRKTNAEGSVQSGDATLGSSFQVSIDNQCTAGTYTKLTVNGAGLVTEGASLSASDIPTLEISTISGLQASLDGKSATTHTHSVKINGTTKTIAASGGAAVDLGSYLSLSGGTVNGNITATKFIGALQGNADTATKLSAKREIFGVEFDGSANVYSSTLSLLDTMPTAPTAYMIETVKGLKGAGSIVWQINGELDLLLQDGDTWGDDKLGVSIEANAVKFNDKPLYYKGSTIFTTDVNSLITEALTPMAADFTAISNRVTAVENQLKWIEIS